MTAAPKTIASPEMPAAAVIAGAATCSANWQPIADRTAPALPGLARCCAAANSPNDPSSATAATKLETPKTNAAAKRALEQLQACGSADDYKTAVKSLVLDLLETAKELETENRLLRNGCSQIAASLGNGSAASPDASVGFLTEGLANEAKLYCELLRSKAGDVTAPLRIGGKAMNDQQTQTAQRWARSEWMDSQEKRLRIWAWKALAAAFVGDEERANEYEQYALREDAKCAVPIAQNDQAERTPAHGMGTVRDITEDLGQ